MNDDVNKKLVVNAQNLCHSYGKGELRTKILHNLNFKVMSGEITLLVGPSGSGKSTLLTLLGALRSVEEGSIQVLGQELNGANEDVLIQTRRRIGFIFQSHNLVSSLTVLQNVQILLQLKEANPQKRIDKATELLEAVGLTHRLNHYPEELSGGQRQRVAIARACLSATCSPSTCSRFWVQAGSVAVDHHYYQMLVVPVWNIVKYNALGGGGGAGADLYGVEPVSFYLKNLFLNFNVVFLLALASLVVRSAARVSTYTPALPGDDTTMTSRSNRAHGFRAASALK